MTEDNRRQQDYQKPSLHGERTDVFHLPEGGEARNGHSLFRWMTVHIDSGERIRTCDLRVMSSNAKPNTSDHRAMRLSELCVLRFLGTQHTLSGTSGIVLPLVQPVKRVWLKMLCRGRVLPKPVHRLPTACVETASRGHKVNCMTHIIKNIQ
jgi:hypothetical protein